MSNTNTFQVGHTYNTGRGSDYVWTFTVIARTAKFITIEDKYGDVTRVGVYSFEGEEHARPLGSYSMCPIIVATREVVAVAA